MDEKPDASRCKQCDHLLSFHGEDGCGTWLLGVRAVPLYRCACIVSVSASGTKFPPLSTTTFNLPALKRPHPPAQLPTPRPLPATSASHPLNLPTTASDATNASVRARLLDVAAELRRTAFELKKLEDVLDGALKRLDTAPASTAPASYKGSERRIKSDRRRRHYAMIADRRVSDRRTESLAA